MNGTFGRRGNNGGDVDGYDAQEDNEASESEGAWVGEGWRWKVR